MIDALSRVRFAMSAFATVTRSADVGGLDLDALRVFAHDQPANRLVVAGRDDGVLVLRIDLLLREEDRPQDVAPRLRSDAGQIGTVRVRRWSGTCGTTRTTPGRPSRRLRRSARRRVRSATPGRRRAGTPGCRSAPDDRAAPAAAAHRAPPPPPPPPPAAAAARPVRRSAAATRWRAPGGGAADRRRRPTPQAGSAVVGVERRKQRRRRVRRLLLFCRERIDDRVEDLVHVSGKRRAAAPVRRLREPRPSPSSPARASSPCRCTRSAYM